MSGDVGAEPRVYRAGMAFREDGVEAVVFDLPGCHCVASDETVARTLLPVVIAEHLAWLDRHGDVTRDAFPFDVEIVERVDAAGLTHEIADGEFCFQDDLRPSTREDVERALRRMGYAREDLLALVRPLPDMVLDWEPPAGAVKQDDWAPGVRTVRGILRHIAGAEGYYAGNVGRAPWSRREQVESPDLFEMRARAVERLRGLADEDLGAEFKRRQPWQEKGYERWTARKALRRFIAHERFHTKEIEQRLAWLLVGVRELAAALKAGA